MIEIDTWSVRGNENNISTSQKFQKKVSIMIVITIIVTTLIVLIIEI